MVNRKSSASRTKINQNNNKKTLSKKTQLGHSLRCLITMSTWTLPSHLNRVANTQQTKHTYTWSKPMDLDRTGLDWVQWIGRPQLTFRPARDNQQHLIYRPIKTFGGTFRCPIPVHLAVGWSDTQLDGWMDGLDMPPVLLLPGSNKIVMD